MNTLARIKGLRLSGSFRNTCFSIPDANGETLHSGQIFGTPATDDSPTTYSVSLFFGDIPWTAKNDRSVNLGVIESKDIPGAHGGARKAFYAFSFTGREAIYSTLADALAEILLEWTAL